MASATPTPAVTATAAPVTTPAASAAAAPVPAAASTDAKAADSKADGPKLVLKERQVPVLVNPGKVSAKVGLDLSKQLKGRSSRADLMKRGLLKEVAEEKKAGAAAGAAPTASSDQIKATGDKLKNFFAQRPTKQRLQQLNVIKEGTEINPTSQFAEMKRQLEDSRRKDMLSNFLSSRPKPEEVSAKLVTHEEVKAKKEDKAKAKDVIADFLSKRPAAKSLLDQKIISDIGDAPSNSDANATLHQLLPKVVDELKAMNIKHIRCGWGHTAALDAKGNLYMFGTSQNGRLGLGEPTHAKRQKAALEAKKAAALRPDVKSDSVAPLASTASTAPNPFGRSGGLGRPLLGGNKGKLLREAALAADQRAAAAKSGAPTPALPIATATKPPSPIVAPAPTPAATPAPIPTTDAKDAKTAAPADDGVKLDEFYSKPQLVKALQAFGPVDVVDLGDHHSAAIVKGKLYTWGEGSWGRLGLGHNEDTWIPTLVDLKAEVAVAVSCGAYHTLVLTASNKVFGFGWNKGGRIGLGTDKPLTVPEPAEVQVISDEKIKIVSLSAGANCSIALDSTGRAYTWGVGSFGNLGHGDEKDKHVPTEVKGLSGKKITHAVFGAAHALALSDSGEIFTWGQNSSQQLGRAGAGGSDLSPGLIQGFDSKSSTHIAAGKAHSALIKGGQLYTWGKGSNGVLGHGNETTVAAPTPVTALHGKTLTAVECGWLHTAVLTDVGVVLAFGGREHGKLGF